MNICIVFVYVGWKIIDGWSFQFLGILDDVMTCAQHSINKSLRAINNKTKL